MPKLSQGTLALAGLAVFAIWLFGVLPFLYGPLPRFAEFGNPQQSHAEQLAAAKADGSVTAPFFIRIPKTAKEEAEEARDRREKTSTDRLLMIFTGAVALFTLLLVGATVLLYRAGEKQLRLSRETAERQLRPYVVGVRGRIVDVDVGRYPTARIRMINTGPTPAYEFMANLGIGFAPANIPKDQFPEAPDHWHGSEATLGPKQRMRKTTTMDVAISASDMSAIKNGTGAIYVVGILKYTDAFEKPRTTRLRLRFDAEALSRGDGRLIHCAEGNESD